MGNVHMPIVKWSKVKIDADKDMQGKSLMNNYDIEVAHEIRKDLASYRINFGSNCISIYSPDGGYFFLSKEGRISPYGVSNPCLGWYGKRWKDGWFSGNLGVGVIKEPDETLTVGVVYQDSDVEKASYLDENTISISGSGATIDYDFGTFNTFTEPGIITKVTVQVEAKNNSDPKAYLVIIEDGIEKNSVMLPDDGGYHTYEVSYYSTKTSCDISIGIRSETAGTYEYTIKNRYLYFAKSYVGIKAGE